MRPLFAAAFALLAAGCAHKPAEPPPQRQQTWEEFVRERPDTFIETYRASIDAETARLSAAGLADDFAFVRAHVDAYLPPGNYTLQATGANAAVLRRLRVDNAANFLVRVGYRIRHLAHPAQARTLARAAASFLDNDPDVLVQVAPIVLVADLDRVERRPDNSAYLVYRVTEVIKSAPPAGHEFRLQLHGPFPSITPKPGDPPPPPPPPNPPLEELSRSKRAVFFLQPPETLVTPREADLPGEPVTVFGPMPLDGDRVLPGYHSGAPETTLPAIRTAARTQICSPGYVPVAPGRSLVQRC